MDCKITLIPGDGIGPETVSYTHLCSGIWSMPRKYEHIL